MTDLNPNEQQPDKDVDEWVTGDEPATGPQLSYLHTLAREAGEDVPETLTKAEASRLIDHLQQASPRTAAPHGAVPRTPADEAATRPGDTESP
ncbi:DUF3072 domain-containing protein [Streptomyces sp. NPDC046557]|uniref:DUF3072 domain-containing protein n=1 Tax=Streptomyces sp. NPDC046557 TaxID=3155372 RepID=UPI0033DB7FA1